MARRLKVILTLIFLIPMMTGSAHAILVSTSYNTTTPIPLTFTDWSRSLSFSKFDPALGTLTQVGLSLSSSMSSVLTITNSESASSSAVGRAISLLFVNIADEDAYGPAFDLVAGENLVMATPRFNFSLEPNQSVTSGVLIDSGSSYNSYDDPGILTLFTGTDSIGIPVFTETDSWWNATGGNITIGQSTQASLTGTITYTYSAVPEPATMLLLGSGLVGLASLFRRKH